MRRPPPTRQGIAGWEERAFREDRSLERVTTGSVVSYLANEEYDNTAKDEDVFRVVFPIDTPVLEMTDNRDERLYYLQGKDGLDPITGDEFSQRFRVKPKSGAGPKR